MRSTLGAVLLMTMLIVQCSPGTKSSDSSDSVFILHINQPVDPAFVTISYNIKGEKSDDGYTNLGRSGPYLDMTTTQDIPISLTLPKEHRATALKAVVFCRGYRLGFVNVPSLAEVPSKRMAIDLVPLGSVALNGRVTLPRDEKPADLRLDVYYNDFEIVFRYLQITEGISGGMKVATTPLAADGSFTTTVPDFANDPVASKDPGRFKFGIRALRPYHGVSERSAAAHIPGQAEFGPFVGIPIALSYPDPIALELHWPN